MKHRDLYRPGDTSVVTTILRQFCTLEGHHFWSANVSIRELLQPEVRITHSQITDVFLLGLAVHKGGKLATFDRGIPVIAIQGGSEALELLVP